MSIRIVTDSSSDLPLDLVSQWGICVVALSVRFGDGDFVDSTTIPPQQFWKQCGASPVLPETTAPSPGQFETTYRRLIAEGATGIVVVTLSSSLSATMQSAELAAKSVTTSEIPIVVIDSRTVSLGLGLIAVSCAQRAHAGGSLNDIVAHANDIIPRTRVFGALDTLDNLKKGGRIGGAKALMASVLSIKPIIEVRNGLVEEGGRQRTRTKALNFLRDTVKNSEPIESLAVLHAQCDDVDAFTASLREVYDGEIVVGDIGPVIGSHAGSGTIGVAFRVRA
ncbi:MAG: DegV family protein [Ilumatobacteraceae bacterium]|nr:DegV family protein [Ilumatobacteraceae bacterium]